MEPALINHQNLRMARQSELVPITIKIITTLFQPPDEVFHTVRFAVQALKRVMVNDEEVFQ
jgi:hypothetical protein